MNTQQEWKKTITFNQPLGYFLNQRAQELGLSFTELIRYLAVKYYEEHEDKIPLVDEETEKNIGMSLKEYNAGDFETIEPGDSKGIARISGVKK